MGKHSGKMQPWLCLSPLLRQSLLALSLYRGPVKDPKPLLACGVFGQRHSDSLSLCLGQKWRSDLHPRAQGGNGHNGTSALMGKKEPPPLNTAAKPFPHISLSLPLSLGWSFIAGL